MELNTAAAVISLLANLEQASEKFYLHWASRLPGFEERLTDLAKENRKHAARIRQAYYNAVTDALETAFSFQGLTADIEIPETKTSATPFEVLQAALRMEKEVQAFYERAAGLAKPLLADLSRVMKRIAEGRTRRQEEIRLLLSDLI